MKFLVGKHLKSPESLDAYEPIYSIPFNCVIPASEKKNISHAPN